MEHHLISAQHLSIDRIREILFRRLPLALSDDARARIVRCREYLDRKMENPERPVYGITTGFGSLCDISVGYDELAQLQKNLVMSHACGTGERVPSEIVKLILLLKIQSLSYGHSGVQLATVERLIDFFNNDVLPVVYQQGSLGASGDLAPLAHMSLPLLGLGEVECEGRVRPAAEVLAERGWQPIRLESKEGLALLNGTQFMSAYGVWSLIGARRLSEWADRIGALSLDAFDGRIEPFCDEVHLIRAHKGQLTTARNIRRLLEGSELIARPKKHVQDPYSFRCIPQVHGASKDTIDYVVRPGLPHVVGVDPGVQRPPGNPAGADHGSVPDPGNGRAHHGSLPDAGAAGGSGVKADERAAPGGPPVHFLLWNHFQRDSAGGSGGLRGGGSGPLQSHRTGVLHGNVPVRVHFTVHVRLPIRCCSCRAGHGDYTVVNHRAASKSTACRPRWRSSCSSGTSTGQSAWYCWRRLCCSSFRARSPI